jgi:hypothetical protein
LHAAYRYRSERERILHRTHHMPLAPEMKHKTPRRLSSKLVPAELMRDHSKVKQVQMH